MSSARLFSSFSFQRTIQKTIEEWTVLGHVILSLSDIYLTCKGHKLIWAVLYPYFCWGLFKRGPHNYHLLSTAVRHVDLTMFVESLFCTYAPAYSLGLSHTKPHECCLVIGWWWCNVLWQEEPNAFEGISEVIDPAGNSVAGVVLI